VNDGRKRVRLLSLTLLLLIPLGIVTVVLRDCFTNTAFDSRWNYRRAGSFFPSTPSISADGSIIVFDSSRTGKGDLFKAYRGTNDAISLIASPAIEMRPVLSKDAKRLAFARQTGGYQHVWLADSNRSNQVQLTHGRVIDYPLSFSSDNSRVRVLRSTFAGRAMSARSHLFEISVTGSSLTDLGPGSAVSEDGKMIVQERYDKNTRGHLIWVISREDGSERQVADGYSPSLSSDGRRIVFLQPTPNYSSYNIILLDVNGGSRRVISAPPGFKTAPEFCLEDAGVIFRIPSSERDGAGGAYITFLDTREVKRLDQLWSEPLP
jgi:Tol biopolymer transport system component